MVRKIKVGASFCVACAFRVYIWQAALPECRLGLCSSHPRYLLRPRALKLQPGGTQRDVVSRFLSTWMLCDGSFFFFSLFFPFFFFFLLSAAYFLSINCKENHKSV